MGISWEYHGNIMAMYNYMFIIIIIITILFFLSHGGSSSHHGFQYEVVVVSDDWMIWGYHQLNVRKPTYGHLYNEGNPASAINIPLGGG